MQIIAIALEDGVGLEVDLHVQVAGGAAVDASLAFAGQADAIALVDPAGILTDRVLCFLTRPWPWQAAQGSLMILPEPWQCGQVCWMEKNPCCMRT